MPWIIFKKYKTPKKEIECAQKWQALHLHLWCMSVICIQAINVHCTVDLCYWGEWSQSERLIGTKVSEKTQNVPKNFAHSKAGSVGS